MERILGALALIALVGIPFWFSRRKKKGPIESWGENNSSGLNGGDVSTHAGDGGHH